MAEQNNRDKCEKCGTINKIYHYIYDEKLKKLNQVWISRKAGEGELVFCSKECCKKYTALCHKCWEYRKGWMWHKTDKKDGNFFCSEKCLNDYYAPACEQCKKNKGYWHDEEKNDGKHFCSQECLNVFYAPPCDICQKKCLKYQRKWSNHNQKSNDQRPVDRLWYYNDAKNKTGKICSECNERKKEYVCDQCGITKKSGGYTHKDKNDGKKFCSDNCFGIHYGYYVESCQECSKKLFRSYQSYCSTCKWKHEQEIRKEEVEKRKKTKELKDSCNNNDLGTTYCCYCSAKTELFDVCDKQECLARMNQEMESKNNNSDNTKENNNNICIEREREREREQNLSEQNKLSSEINNLEQNHSNPQNQTELSSKKKQLQDLQSKEKALMASLPLDTQITILQKEIKDLNSKSSKSKTEESILESKKKELEKLLKRQNNANTTENKPSDKTGLYVGCGVIGIFALLLILILVRNRKKKKY